MAFDLEKVEERLDAISLDLMMASPANLVEISGLLGRVEALGEAFAQVDSELPGPLVSALTEGLKAILLGQAAKADQVLEKVGQGVTILAELSRSLPMKADFNPARVTAFQAEMTQLADAPGFWAEVEQQAATEATAPEPSPPEPSPRYLAAPWPDAPSLEGFKTQFSAAVEEIQVLLVSLDQKSEPLAALSALTRPFRTILGASRLANFQDASDLAFNANELVEYVLTDHLPYSPGVADILLSACGYLLKGFHHLEMQPDEALGRVLRPTDAAYTPQELAAFNEQLWIARQGVLPVKPASGPPPAASAAKPKKIGEILGDQGLSSKGDLGGLMAARKDERQEDPKEAEPDEFTHKSQDGAQEKVAQALRAQKQSEAGAAAQASPQVVKVETQKLDGIIDMVGELVIAQSLVNSSPSIALLREQKLSKDLSQVTRITSALQRNAMSLRMVPIAATFHKMNRLVRDLAHKFEKDVRMETVGAETEVDRNMVDSLYDPLVHMVRNSLDHGLESPAERRAAGKPPQGVVRLKAYHQSGNVVVEVQDDGRGLDKEKVLKKAVDKGLVPPGKALSDAAIHALVFQPGFSTADQVSEISGRGVGMDVVQQSIEKLRGKVEFTSVMGQSSTMTLWLPLTLAIIDGMIIRVGEHRYILPTVSILESFRPLQSDYYTVNNQGEMIKVRDTLVPLLRLGHLVGAEGGVTRPEDGLVVMVEHEGETRCLLVDEVLGKQEVVIKSLGERLKGVRTLAGGTILGDGRVGLILDVAGLCGAAAGMNGGQMSARPDGGATDDWGMGDG